MSIEDAIDNMLSEIVGPTNDNKRTSTFSSPPPIVSWYYFRSCKDPSPAHKFHGITGYNNLTVSLVDNCKVDIEILISHTAPIQHRIDLADPDSIEKIEAILEHYDETSIAEPEKQN